MKPLRYLLFVAWLLVLPVNHAAVAVPAADLTWQSVSNAIATANAGDVVVLPAGSNNWGNVELVSTKRIYITGLGQARTTIGKTTGRAIRIAAFTSGTNVYGYSHFRVAGGSSASFGLLALGTSTGYPATSSNYNYRVHHVTFDYLTNRGMYIVGKHKGVVDHCTFKAYNNIVAQGYTVQGVTRAGTVEACNQSCQTYTNTLSFGTYNDFAYIEDCIWDWLGDGDGALDHYNDVNAVARFNFFTNCNYMVCHESAYNRSSQAIEMYGNKAYGTGPGIGFDAISHIRAGAWIACSNELTTTGYTMTQPGPRLTYYRSSGRNVFPDYPAGYYSAGSVTGTNRLDGNLNVVPDEYGYPAMDQPGWADPQVATTTNLTQTFYGCYFKDNMYLGANVPVVVDSFASGGNPDNVDLTGAAGAGVWIANSADLIQEGRDYFNQTLRPGWSPAPYPHELVTNVALSPASAAPAPLATVDFDGSGGSGTYVYFVLVENNSGGSVNSTTGLYTAGAIPGVVDKLLLIDSYGNESEANISVTEAPSVNPGVPSNSRRRSHG